MTEAAQQQPTDSDAIAEFMREVVRFCFIVAVLGVAMLILIISMGLLSTSTSDKTSAGIFALAGIVGIIMAAFCINLAFRSQQLMRRKYEAYLQTHRQTPAKQ